MMEDDDSFGVPLAETCLTDIGNTLLIRHAETDRIPVADSSQVDYLFHRLFSMIRLLLRASGRGT